ncbi:DUF2290 domain-containing protein [Clostridium perfringens]|uniref:DUF2290 domain-containing protein n=1 Tax=Clostridium perfringens TaxID=1502 RepID=UPI0024BCB99C|nr:DUF2290 domain-containing protein [Clostridium perfringens]EIF6155128.1 DUF2290 domain-containing protein [Clostridium perfringens]EJT5928367.1 DUF2290 domain-containing protein [Clostridium perfringens]EJT6483088.1 DUF2290 domain-containing protein [Clostridium perfringens]MDU6209358.1 DUF2290 domain-containing protein [Clostridium perfringens]BDA23375.1 hypothetical protein CPBEC1_25850 [Clostridium perfringens]
MISKSNIAIGYRQAIDLLRDVGLFKCENISRKMNYSKNKFSKEFIHVSQSNSYREIYDIAMQKGDYDILLQDNSFFQFSYEHDNESFLSIRYAYYNAPYDIISYKEFLENEGFLYNEVHDEFLEIYDQYITEAELKNQVIPLRYDYDTIAYRPIVHASSHMHIGHNNDIRIPCDKIILPQTFVSFVLKHVYFNKYKEKIKEEQFKENYLKKISCSGKFKSTLDDEEKKDIYLCL